MVVGFKGSINFSTPYREIISPDGNYTQFPSYHRMNRLYEGWFLLSLSLSLSLLSLGVRCSACPIPDVEIWFQLRDRHFPLFLSTENLKALVVHDISSPEVTKIVRAHSCWGLIWIVDWGGNTIEYDINNIHILSLIFQLMHTLHRL